MSGEEGLGDVVRETTEGLTVDPLLAVRPVVRTIQAQRLAASAALQRAVVVALRFRSSMDPTQAQELDTVAAWLGAADFERQLSREFPGYAQEGLARAHKLESMALELAAQVVGLDLPPS